MRDAITPSTYQCSDQFVSGGSGRGYFCKTKVEDSSLLNLLTGSSMIFPSQTLPTKFLGKKTFWKFKYTYYSVLLKPQNYNSGSRQRGLHLLLHPVHQEVRAEVGPQQEGPGQAPGVDPREAGIQDLPSGEKDQGPNLKSVKLHEGNDCPG